jgi:hypothetical protein
MKTLVASLSAMSILDERGALVMPPSFPATSRSASGAPTSTAPAVASTGKIPGFVQVSFIDPGARCLRRNSAESTA